MTQCDFLIIGSGITGLTIAHELFEQGYDNIIILEKEEKIGLHASGRNSGVLHSGIYYTPDSLKARFCAEGNRLLKEYCRKNEINILNSGKVIVASDSEKLKSIELLYERAVKNGVRCEIIDEKKLGEIEPYAYTYNKALYSPDTAVFNPIDILNSLYGKLVDSGKVRFLFNTRFLDINGSRAVITSSGNINYVFLINAAGSFSEKVAQCFSLAMDYRILPFLGTYKKIKPSSSYLVNSNVYPVPDLNNPFLGVHLTKSIESDVFIGPTAFPALGRESYRYLYDLDIESVSILYRDFVLFFLNKSFRSNALNELKKYMTSFVFKEAKKLIPSLRREDLVNSNKVGIRPQLVDWPNKKLVMDFILIKDSNTLHILNAISPTFTSSMAFAKHVVQKIGD